MKIQRLTARLANQIAAGEVIERPASIVKELLENSIDAGAQRIEIEIEKGGKRLIRVRDDGSGIAKDDLALALERHATSKIHEFADLEQIASLGFRGEALASISAVSRLSLSSCTAQASEAWQVYTEGADMTAVLEPVAHPVGTTVEVRDIFFNTPARRKFLRTDKTEYQHVEELAKHIVLSHFNVSFLLRHNGETIFQIKAAETDIEREKRVIKLLGASFMKQAFFLDREATGLRLWGWLAKASFSRSQTDQQHFYINGRIVKDKLVRHALRQAYDDYLPEGRHAAYVLYLELDPGLVDINVHPTKHEVRFRDSRLLHDFISTCVQQALLHDVPKQPVLPSEQTVVQPSFTDRPKAGYPTYQYQTEKPAQVAEQVSVYQQLHESAVVMDESVELHNLGKPLALLQQKYLLIDNETGLLIIDSQIAQSLISYTQLQSGPIVSQALLIPVNLQVSKTLLAIAEQQTELLQSLGFVIETIGPEALLVRKIPKVLQGVNVTEIVSDLLSHLQESKEALLLLMAKYHGKATTINNDCHSMNKLLQSLFEAEKIIFHRHCEERSDKAIHSLLAVGRKQQLHFSYQISFDALQGKFKY